MMWFLECCCWLLGCCERFHGCSVLVITPLLCGISALPVVFVWLSLCLVSVCRWVSGEGWLSLKNSINTRPSAPESQTDPLCVCSIVSVHLSRYCCCCCSNNRYLFCCILCPELFLIFVSLFRVVAYLQPGTIQSEEKTLDALTSFIWW